MSFLSFLFGNSIVCPFCLTDNRYSKQLENCLKCGTALPFQYRSNYKEALPFYVQLIGWTRVGKTVYLQTLALMLKKMERFWGNDYVCSPLTESTLAFMENVKTYEVDGEMPFPTQVKLHDAFIMLLQGMERWGGRTLVTRDVAGENFTSTMQFPIEYMPYLVHVPVSIMMISLSDLKAEKKQVVDNLINSYVDTLVRHRPNYKSSGLKVIVALSKADKLKSELPDELKTYLESDPFNIRINRNQFVDDEFMNEYMEKLYKASAKIKEWFAETQPGGQMFINKAKRENLSLEFTLVSSTGTDPGADTKMLVDLNPLRVLDPYFLALDYYSTSPKS